MDGPTSGGAPWDQQAAPILRTQDQRDALTVPRRRGGLLGALTRHQAPAGTRALALAHFRQGPVVTGPASLPALRCLCCPGPRRIWPRFSAHMTTTGIADMVMEIACG